MNYFTEKPLIYLVSIFISSIGFLHSQNHEHDNCGTHTSTEQIEFFNSIRPQLKPLEQQFLSKQFDKNTTAPKIVNSIPIKAHIIRKSDGTGGINNDDLNEAIETLNEYFSSSNFEFFLCDGVNYINNDFYNSSKKGDDSSFLESNNIPGLVNIYFTDYLKNESGENICGYSNNEINQDFIVIKNDCAIDTSSLAHEMGHIFSLIHTHGTHNTVLTTELVDGSNCDTDGDGICDTPADPKLSTSNVNSSCEYTGSKTDANGHAFKPDTSNLMSYSRKSCRTHFSPQQLARMYAFYITQKSYLSCSRLNADFTTDISQTCENSLTVSFNSECEEATKWLWDVDSDGIIDYTVQNPTHNFNSGIYDVTLTVSNNLKTISKTYSQLIKVGVTTETLFDENFNEFEIAGDNGWTVNDVSNSGYKWLLNKGETASKSTGPANNNKEITLGNYIYAEASGATLGSVTEFISPCIDVVYDNSVIDFSYHMFGENIGELHVDIKTESDYYIDVIEPLVGSQQTEQSNGFLTTEIDLSPYVGETINLTFRAIRGDGWKGDIAIDNIFLKTISAPISSESVKLYPNPIKNNQLYIRTNYVVEDDEQLFYEISNLVGQKFSSGVVVPNQPYNTGNLPSGTYLLTIYNNYSRVVKRFIK